MGLDLTLLLIECGHEEWGYAHTMLDCERRRDLFDAIMEGVQEQPIPKNFYTFRSREDGEDSHYGKTTTTPYGEPIGCVSVRALRAFADHVGVLDNYINRATWAYLKELPDDLKIALYWH